MPNIQAQDTIVQSLTDSAQTQYPFAFYAPDKKDIQVFYQSPDSIPSPETDLLLLDTDYTVTFNDNPYMGGIITLLFMPNNGWYLTINRQVQASLNTQFSNAQNFNGTNLDIALDRLLLLIQQNFSYAYNRNLGYVINTYIPYTQPNNNTVLQNPYTQLPPLGANQIWQGTGSGVGAFTLEENPNVSTLRAELASNIVNADGAALIGYYDNNNAIQTTVDAFLDNLPTMLQRFIYSYSVDTGSANTYVATLSPSYSAYSAGQKINVLIANANTSPTCTLNINGLGGKTITLANGSSIVAGDITAGMIATFVYDGTHMQLLNPVVARQKPAMAASVYCSTSHTFSSTTPANVLFDTVRFDPYGFFDSANNRFIAKYAGKYRISSNLGIYSGGSGTLGTAIQLLLTQNGSIVQLIGEAAGILSNQITINGSYIINASANDLLQIQIVLSSSVTLNYASSPGSYTPQQLSDFTIEYLGT